MLKLIDKIKTNFDLFQEGETFARFVTIMIGLQ